MSTDVIVQLKNNTRLLTRGLNKHRFSDTSHGETRARQKGACIVSADISTFAHLLRSCSSSSANALSDGRLIHHHIIRHEFDQSQVLAGLLVYLYTSCGALEDACVLLALSSQHNIFTWNFLFKAYASHGQGPQALQLYSHMRTHGVMPNKVTFLSLLNACAENLTFHELERLHSHIIGCDLESDTALGTSLVNLYAKIGSLKDALMVFSNMHERDVAAWTVMMSVYIQHSHMDAAIRLFGEMQDHGVVPNKVTFLMIVTGCDSPTSLCYGNQMYFYMMEMGLEIDVVLTSALVNMYGKCGSLEDARITFHSMAIHSVFSWNAVIAAHAHHHKFMEAIKYLKQMQVEGWLPSKETFIATLAAYKNNTMLGGGKQMHTCIVSCGFESDIMVGNALVNMYGKCGSTMDAQVLFNELPERNIVSWTTMITGCSQHGLFERAVAMFVQMQVEGIMPNTFTYVSIIAACTDHGLFEQGKRVHACSFGNVAGSNVTVGNALLNMYGKFGTMANAHAIFDDMEVRDIITWTSLIARYAEHGHINEAMNFHDKMLQECLAPNPVTFVTILSAYSRQFNLFEGRRVHACSVESGLEVHISVGNALISMYGECGSMEDAHWMFSRMIEHDLVSWNSILTVLAQHGQGTKAVELFNQMRNKSYFPDNVTFTSVLTACSHTGLVEEACKFFVLMVQDVGLSPAENHYVCMIDLLGRAGRLDEAGLFVDCMPVQPIGLSLMALLAACQYHANMEQGEKTAKQLIERDPESIAPYVFLSNIHVSAGRREDAGTLATVKQARRLNHTEAAKQVLECVYDDGYYIWEEQMVVSLS